MRPCVVADHALFPLRIDGVHAMPRRPAQHVHPERPVGILLSLRYPASSFVVVAIEETRRDARDFGRARRREELSEW
jgi:hypothetical protein